MTRAAFVVSRSWTASRDLEKYQRLAVDHIMLRFENESVNHQEAGVIHHAE
jgi:hypothetical protein